MKLTLHYIVMVPLILLFIFGARQSTEVSATDLRHLTHVNGIVSSYKTIKHKKKLRYFTVYEDVLVLRVRGYDEEFGFLGDDKNRLIGLLGYGNQLNVDIYFDRSGEQIEGSFTNMLDLTINGTHYIKIETIKENERTASIVFAFGAVVLIGFTYYRAKRIKRQGKIRKY